MRLMDSDEPAKCDGHDYECPGYLLEEHEESLKGGSEHGTEE